MLKFLPKISARIFLPRIEFWMVVPTVIDHGLASGFASTKENRLVFNTARTIYYGGRTINNGEKIKHLAHKALPYESLLKIKDLSCIFCQ